MSADPFKGAAELSPLMPDRTIELKLTVERVQTAFAPRERSGLRFLRMISFTIAETVTTDRLLVTEEAVRCLNHPTK